MERVELLAPARDLECGLAAVNCGADAVYIGAARFGARVKAGNSLADIETLVCYAHRYWAKVYVTINTLLYDHEVPEAVDMIHHLYEVGVDAAIIQDVGLLECDLPPLPLIASTQMHNDTLDKVRFLEAVGFSRVILARELSLDQIRTIRQGTEIELEAFVHGALCVSYSGQCYMSYAIGGRSGNRGECAQPCRRRYDLVDEDGMTWIAGRHLLSLRDLNRSSHLAELLEAGVRSFKIEGRLKDRSYVMNVVSAYRCALDEVLEGRGWAKSSSGRIEIDWTPDLNKTFNRGYTTYFLHSRDAFTPGEMNASPGEMNASPGAIETPKMVGEFVGRVTSLERQSIVLDAVPLLHSGDGLCFFDVSGELRGTFVHGVQGRTVRVGEVKGMQEGTVVYRNHDHAFLSHLDKAQPERRIAVRMRLSESPEGFALVVVDEDGNEAVATLAWDRVLAEKPGRALATAERQLRKVGDTAFSCAAVEIAWERPYFLPLSALNALRREALERLVTTRAKNRPVTRRRIVPNDAAYPAHTLTYMGNVLNQEAAAFYRRHGVEAIELAPESGLDMQGRQVMRTRYCVRRQLGFCLRAGGREISTGELALVDEDGRHFALHFDCVACEMAILMEK